MWTSTSGSRTCAEYLGLTYLGGLAHSRPRCNATRGRSTLLIQIYPVRNVLLSITQCAYMTNYNSYVHINWSLNTHIWGIPFNIELFKYSTGRGLKSAVFFLLYFQVFFWLYYHLVLRHCGAEIRVSGCDVVEFWRRHTQDVSSWAHTVNGRRSAFKGIDLGLRLR